MGPLASVDLEQIDCQLFFSKDGLIQDQQKIAVWGLPPW